MKHALLLAFVAALHAPADAQEVRSEADAWAVDYLVVPDGARVEVGGLGFLPDGRLVASTRRGQVWLVDNPLAPTASDASFSLFAEGLQEGLGLTVVGDEIYVLQRAELSRLVDEDGDGRCDRIDTVADDWGVSGHYHEFAFGLPRDAQGNFYLSLNVSFGDPHWWHGRSTVPYRGWVMKVTPDGSVHPFASGFRSPCGLGMFEGDLFETDNQGDWMAACPIFHVKEGSFYGHPAALNWTDEYRSAERIASDTEPPSVAREPAACWMPYDWARSAGELLVDDTGGKFGPFAGQLFVAELTNGLILRANLEKVRGEWQGAVIPFRQHVGSAVRLAFASDGTLFTGFTDRGWGGQRPGDGIARVRWTGRMPLEMHSIHLVDDGFDVRFTRPVAANSLAQENVTLAQYDYDYWWEYGSPVRHLESLSVGSATLSADRQTLALRGCKLAPAKMARVRLVGLAADDGSPLLHEEFAYTINQLPNGPATKELVVKEVPAPDERESWQEGVLFLTRGEALDAWKQTGWTVADASLMEGDASRFELTSPAADQPMDVPVLTNPGPEPSDLVTRYEFGDADVHVEFYLPQRGNSGVYLMGRYEVQLFDSSLKLELRPTGRFEAQRLDGEPPPPLDSGDCGAIYAADDAAAWPGKPPMFNAFRGPGEWHELNITFRAPRFDAGGQKVENARFLRVLMDDVLLQENVEVPGPTRGGWAGEAPLGPLRLQGDHGPVAFRNLRVRARREAAEDRAGWARIFDGGSLEGWKSSDNGAWKVEEGSIVGSGKASHLFSPRGDYTDLELRAKCKISDGGNSGMYFRVAYGPGWPSGYEAQVNSTYAPDPVKTGSLYGMALIKTALVAPDTWFEQHVTCKDEPEGTRVVIRVNGVVVTDFVDTTRKFSRGHVALQQHHEGSVVRYKDVEVRELR